MHPPECLSKIHPLAAALALLQPVVVELRAVELVEMVYRGGAWYSRDETRYCASDAGCVKNKKNKRGGRFLRIWELGMGRMGNGKRRIRVRAAGKGRGGKDETFFQRFT